MTRLGHLSTEGARAERAEIDRLPTAELVRLMNDDDAPCRAAVAAARGADRGGGRRDRRRGCEAGGRLIYVGAGTAGRIGVLDASECGPTFNTDRVLGVIAGGPGRGQRPRPRAPRTTPPPARGDRRARAARDDAVVGISASGRTPYVLGAIERARARGRADRRARLQRRLAR